MLNGSLYTVKMPSKKKPYSLPDSIDVSSIYIDESGARNSRGGFFVVGFVKVREPYALARAIRHLRQKHRFHGEIHFAQISRNQMPFYFDLVEELADANVRVGGSVYDSQLSFNDELATWEQQSLMAAQLIRGNINRGELVNVFLDLVQTPQGESAARTVKQQVNKKLGSRSVIEAYDVDSRSTDLIQLADVVASSINYERCHPEGGETAKARVAARLRRALELDSFSDVQAGKVNILTIEGELKYS